MGKKHDIPEKLPCHIAIILDGNGRWAARRGLPRAAGHLAGSENFRRISTFCKSIGIEYLTVYAFSTENWLRPKDETDAIMNLFRRYLNESIEKMETNRVRIRVMGDLSMIPGDIKELIVRTQELSEKYTGVSLQICINYGARNEIVRAVRKIIKTEHITEEMISASLDSAGIPDPDLCIRPGGEKRLSNFLLWQLAYSELFFYEKNWPDFNEKDLVKILWEFSERDRRFGGIKK